MPDLDGLVGWEFRGINHLPLNALPFAQLVGIKKFVKGFFRDEDGRVMGYNCPVAQNVLDGRWHAKPSDTAPKRFGFYEVDAGRSDARATTTYLHARPARLRQGRQQAVRSVARACATTSCRSTRRTRTCSSARRTTRIGPARLGRLNFFILERHRRGLTDYASR